LGPPTERRCRQILKTTSSELESGYSAYSRLIVRFVPHGGR
jgi:hypothetical protein